MLSWLATFHMLCEVTTTAPLFSFLFLFQISEIVILQKHNMFNSAKLTENT